MFHDGRVLPIRNAIGKAIWWTAPPPASQRAILRLNLRSGVSLGVLKCKTIPGSRDQLLIHSSVGLNCVFETPNGKESYKGESGIGLGIDLSWDRVENIAYTVLSASKDYKMGSYGLAVKFIGAKASATAGVGLGAGRLRVCAAEIATTGIATTNSPDAPLH